MVQMRKSTKIQTDIINYCSKKGWEAAKLATSKVGWSDVIVFIPSTGVTYYVEVKTTDKESAVQKRFRMKANTNHKRATVVKSFNEFINFIKGEES